MGCEACARPRARSPEASARRLLGGLRLAGGARLRSARPPGSTTRCAPVLEVRRAPRVVVGRPVPEGLDAIYTFDPAIVASTGAVCAAGPARTMRLPEAEAVGRRPGGRRDPDLGDGWSLPATSGRRPDTIWLDDRTLLVGRGYSIARMQAGSSTPLRAALPGRRGLIELDLPYHHGSDEVMHLLSLLSPVSHDAGRSPICR